MNYKYELDYDLINDVANYWDDKMPMMLMEEAGELIQAVSKYERHFEPNMYESERQKYRAAVVEEMRDMYISMAALQNLYGIRSDEINKEIVKKLNKKY